jgi:hypothetical protein
MEPRDIHGKQPKMINKKNLNLHRNLLCIHPISSDADADREFGMNPPDLPLCRGRRAGAGPLIHTSRLLYSSVDSYAHADANRSKWICRCATSFSKGVWFPRLKLN